MSYPVVQSVASWWTYPATDTTTHVPDALPSGIVAGDLLLCHLSADGSPTCTASAGWTKLGQASYSTTVTGAIFWKIATGSDDLTITTSTSQQVSGSIYRISGAASIEGASSNGSSTNPDPPSFTAVDGSGMDCLWMVTHAGDGTVFCTGAPSGYGNLNAYYSGSSTGTAYGEAYRTATGGTENPGTFTAATEQWVCWTLCVVPAPVTEARLSVVGPLTIIPTAEVLVGDRNAWMATSGPLGVSPAILLDAAPVALLAASGPLGSPAIVGVLPRTLRAAVTGPLGTRSRLRLEIEDRLALLAVPGPLGVPALRAKHRAPRALWWSLPGPLGTPRGFAQQRFVTPLGPSLSGSSDARQRLLSDPFPLRRASVLPGYREDVILPWVFGRAAVRPVALDPAGLEWLVADHPIVGVTAVRDGSATVTGWQLVQQLDATGRAVATLRLTQPPDGDLAVDVAGRRHPATGAILEHPADIAEELLRACGWAVPVDAFAAIRDAYPGVILGGVLDAAVTLREAVSRVLGSVDADWSAYPLRAFTATPGDALATITPANCHAAIAEATHASLCNTLRVTYGYDWAAGEPRGSLTVRAPEVMAEQGELAQDLDLPWIRTARDALALATAALQRRARPLWSFRLSVGAIPRYQPSDTLNLDHAWVPSGPALITLVDHEQTGQTLTARRWAGAPPWVELVTRGALLDGADEEAIQVTYRDGIATFTVLDDLGNPLANATVTLDGQQTRTTDRSGLVQFTTPRGVHTLLITATGYATQELEITV